MHDTNHCQDIIKPNQLRQKIRRSTDEWNSIIADYKTSGLTQRDFCQQRDIAYSSFTNWLIKLKKLRADLSTESSPSALFIDVSADKPLLQTEVNEWDVELAFANGTVLRLKTNTGLSHAV